MWKRNSPSQHGCHAAKQDGEGGVGSPSLTLDLNQVRDALIRMEDSIIFAIIERSQFLLNRKVYQPGGIPVPGFFLDGRQYSMVEYLLRETEQMHGRIRRYTSPDEHPFYPDDLPNLVLPPVQYPNLLHPYAAQININDQVLGLYFEELLPRICEEGDDGNYGSCSLSDIDVLQALSKRIHYGKYVAESKFKARPDLYEPLIREKDKDGIMDLLTVESVERKVVRRVRNKACVFGQDIQDVMGTISLSDVNSNSTNSDTKVEPDRVAKLYNEWIMPLNKEVQLEYLLHRLD
jgi:chorismate mutase